MCFLAVHKHQRIWLDDPAPYRPATTSRVPLKVIACRSPACTPEADSGGRLESGEAGRGLITSLRDTKAYPYCACCFCSARVRHDFHSEVKAFVADGAKERIVVLTPNAASMRQCREGHLPADPLHVRLIRVELESGEVEVLITSLRDTKAYPYCAFAKLYALRWGIEENYKREKQRLEIENFSGRTPWVLLQDFHAKIFAQNLTAIFVRLAQWLADARYQHRRHGYRINFANALSKMKNNLVRLFLETSPLELSWRLLQRMADAVEAVRPGRKFPRDMKKVRVPGFQMQYRRTR